MTEAARTASTLRAFIQRRRLEILAKWRGAARSMRPARNLSPVALLDHIPDVLDALADIAEEILAGTADPRTFATARPHALDRLAEGFDISTIVEELSLLRGCLLALWERDRTDGSFTELSALNLAVDHAIAASVVRYSEVRERKFIELADDRERALAELESLLAASPVGIAFLDRELRYQRVNEALATLNGRPVAAHIGRTVAEVIPEMADRIVPELRRVVTMGESLLNVDVEVTPVTGERLSLLANYFPVRASSGAVIGIGGVVVDVGHVKRAHEALHLEQARLQSIIDHAPAAIWAKDPQGRLILANRRLATALGVDYEQMIGRRSDEVLPPLIANEHQAHDERVLRENQAIEVEELAPSADGLRTFLTVKFPIPGTPPLIGGIATDITDRKRMEQDLKVAVHMRDDLLSVVSHDLRSPLATIQLSAALLVEQLAADPRAQRALQRITRSSARMESLINDLLDVALIREGRFKLALRRESILDVVCEAVELQQPLASEKGVILVRTCELRGVEAMCDRKRLLQVFGNLIGNAIKFCRRGDTIRVLCQHDGPFVRFCVEDTGPGIAASALPKLFEPYWSSPEHAAKGSGLGLYIVRGIVESHGGHVWAESEPGAGARLSFTLPVAG